MLPCLKLCQRQDWGNPRAKQKFQLKATRCTLILFSSRFWKADNNNNYYSSSKSSAFIQNTADWTLINNTLQVSIEPCGHHDSLRTQSKIFLAFVIGQQVTSLPNFSPDQAPCCRSFEMKGHALIHFISIYIWYFDSINAAWFRLHKHRKQQLN